MLLTQSPRHDGKRFYRLSWFCAASNGDAAIYSNYDNQPAPGADERDYGVITSLGATF
jgi:hypothetical protein